MKVYVLEEGQYEGHIVGIYATRALAEKVMEMTSWKEVNGNYIDTVVIRREYVEHHYSIEEYDVIGEP